MKIFNIFVTLTFCFVSFTLYAIEIDLADFGVKGWSFENASPAIVKALGSAKERKNVVLKFPGGRIDLWPEGSIKKELYISNSIESDTLSKIKNIGICLENFSNIILKGNNTTIILHGKMVSFAVLNCHNVTIQNIQFDYERPTMSELKVLFVSDTLLKLRVHPDTKFQILKDRIIFYGEGWRTKQIHCVVLKPDKDIMSYFPWKYQSVTKAVKEGCNILALKGNFLNTSLKMGDILTLRDPYRDNCGAFINQSKNVTLENVKMHYMHGLGIVSQFSENIVFKKVNVVPRKEAKRAIAAFADCFHFSGCKGLIEIDSCRISGTHDDPINIHGTYLKIIKIEDGNRLIVRFMHPQTYGFNAFFPGDSVAFVKPKNLLIYNYGKIKSVKMVSKYEMMLITENNLPMGLEEGDCLENISWTPSVIVRNCYFERISTRGLLVTTCRPVLIENNTFFRTGMHAILVAGDCNFWYESGPVKDVTIKGNKFIQCGYNQGENGYIISIQPEVHSFKKGHFIHSNIRINDNIFECIRSPVLFALAAENLEFKNNLLLYNPLEEKVQKPKAFIALEHCEGVNVKNNVLKGFQNANVEIHLK